MGANRIFGEGEILAFPRPMAAASWPVGFVICPLAVWAPGGAGGWVSEIYRLAYQQAQEALRPSWHDRAVRASWN